MSKQTAVKWLEKAFYKSAWSAYAESTGVNNKWLIDEECLAELFNQAKAMEREQLKEMYLKGIENYDPTFKRKGGEQ